MTQELTMTREEKALIYFKDLRARKFKDYSSVFDTAPKDSVVYEAVSAEIEIYDTTIKALEQESVLDKIKAEIEALSNANPSYTHTCDVVDRHFCEPYKIESNKESEVEE